MRSSLFTEDFRHEKENDSIPVFPVFCVFILLFLVVSEVLKDKRIVQEYDASAKVKGFYEEKEDTLDFVFVGSSQLYADIAPAVLFSEYGITSYDFCANEQPLWISYYYIKEALKHQKPKAIVLDVFTVYGAEYEEEGVNHINIDDLPWSMNKVQAIWNGVPKDLQYSFFLTLTKYHDTWNTLDESKIESSFYHKRNVYRGYSPFTVRHAYGETAPDEVVMQTEREPVPDRARLWLDQIVELTKEEGVDLILIKTPNGNADRQKLYNSVSDYAKEKDIPFVNMNTVFDGEAHINVLQAEKVSKYIGGYLAAHYKITDKRKDAAFADWAEDSAYFYRKKAKCELISTDDLEAYTDFLSQQDYVTMVAVKSGDAASENTLISQEQKDCLAALGLYPDYTMNGSWCYLALVRNGNEPVLQFQTQTEQTESYELPYEEGCLITNTAAKASEKEFAGLPHSFTLQSSLQEDGLHASFLMGEDNYCLDQDGINFFVYDPLLSEIVEFTAFAPGETEVLH